MEKIYKKILLAMFMAIVAVGFTACGDKDDEPVEPETLVGTWHSSRTESENGMNYSYNETLVFNSDHTGYTSISVTVTSSSRASESYSYSVNEQFSWTDSKTSDNIGYISFIHTGGDEIYGSGRYTYTLAGKNLHIADVTFTK